MKAAILVELKKPLLIAEVEVPSLKYGQVLVKIAYSGVCGSQLGEIEGVKGGDKYLPHLLGHEASGIVQETGEGVKITKPGDHVVLHWRKGVGIQAATPKYSWGQRLVNAGWVTTFNEYAVVSENRVTPIPKTADLEVAALYGCAVTTGFGVVNNDASVKIGESVAIFGVGGVGLSEILGARLVGAFPIIAVDIYDDKLARARAYGATHVINSRKQNVGEEMRRLLPEGRVDVAVDNSGHPEVIELAYEVTLPSGRTIMVGVPGFDQKISIDSLPLHFEKRLMGSHGGNANPTNDIPRYLRLMSSGAFDLRPMISHRFPLNDINQALDAMREGKVVRCLIVM